jgi:hypothetical protein
MNNSATVGNRQRPKAGKGKLFFGMTPGQIARLTAVRTPVVDLNSHFSNLRLFTEIYVGHARDLARSGQKDEARDWCRFFENSKILSILEYTPEKDKLTQLRESLKELGSECHPMDVANWQTDIEAIRACLTDILAHVKKKPRKTKTVGRFDTSGSIRVHHGYGQPR